MGFVAFQRVLKNADSPVLPFANECFNLCLKYRIEPAFLLAIIRKESSFGREGFARLNKSPGNTRSTRNKKGVVTQTVKGPLVRYARWVDGWDDECFRFTDPVYVYVLEGRVTIERVIYRHSPPEDGNATEEYIVDAVEWMNEWLEESNTVEIIDLSGSTPSSVYTSRDMGITELILHDTSGRVDNNNASPDMSGCA